MKTLTAVVLGLVLCFGMPMGAKAADPTLADILKVWEEREKACVSLEMSWKETTHIPKGTISKIFFNQKDPISKPIPPTDIQFDGEGKFSIKSNDFSSQLDEVLFSKIHKDYVYQSKCRVVLQGDNLSYLNLTQATTRVPYAFEVGKNSIQCPANGIGLLLNVLVRGKSGGYWDLYSKGVKSLLTEKQNLNGKSMLNLEVTGDPTMKLLLFVDQTDLFRLQKMSIVYPKSNNLQQDFVLEYQENSTIPRRILVNNYRDYGQPLLVSSHNIEVTSWDVKDKPSRLDYQIDYPKQTMIQKQLPNGKTETSGIASDGTRQVITEIIPTQDEFISRVEQKAKQNRQREYIWIAGGLLLVFSLGVFVFRVKRKK